MTIMVSPTLWRVHLLQRETVKGSELTSTRGQLGSFNPLSAIWSDGYIHHQNDHLSGRMTDISVMGE